MNETVRTCDEPMTPEDARAALLAIARNGTFTKEAILASAFEQGVSLLRQADPARYDPHGAAQWNIGMVLVWIMTRDSMAVRWFWPTYAEQCQSWEEVGFGPAGPCLVPGPRKAMTANWLLNLWDRLPMSEEAGMKAVPGFPDPQEARFGLWEAAEAGLLTGTAFDFRQQGGQELPIKRNEWRALSLAPSPDDGRDMLRMAPASPFLAHVVFQRDDVLRLWPARDANSQIYPTSSAGISIRIQKPTSIVEMRPMSPPAEQGRPSTPSATAAAFSDLQTGDASAGQKRGRPSKYPWAEFHAQCLVMWNYHGGFTADDPTFSRPSHLVAAMNDWCQMQVEKSRPGWLRGPADSAIKSHVREFLTGVSTQARKSGQ